ncbi:flavin-containing monooxygenase [Streptomyces cadmiisoli]|uniref:Monooxygenase n=1 Tax=Streptomyces cadmiisoli TaxID=2184053 RepID=A0A2Z4IS00_9ACTN|nr:NAD(P)/FAD-dependent oxidoreductase [Streptomyces cadmiisoli]AWW35544.1 monooxygenase [Streptomyces cadmiisoli]
MTNVQGSALSEAVTHANIPTLLMVAVQLGGDLTLLDRYRLTRPRGLSDHDTGGLEPHQQRELRELALRVIEEWRAGKPVAIPRPDSALLVRMLSAAMGEPVPDEYAEMIASSLGLEPVMDLRPTSEEASPRSRVIVIGGGVSGVCAAVALEAKGYEYVVIEKSDRVGGVWNDNNYPGVGVDTPSHLYSYSFVDYDWKSYFSPGADIREYLDHVVDTFGIRHRFAFNTEVLSAEYSDDDQSWTVSFVRPDGSRDAMVADAVISAVGIFNPPKLPDLPGKDDFEGPSFHSELWPDGLDVTGKRVGIVGNGATAMQIVPAIADRVEHLTIFQRSQHWIVPFEKLHQRVPDAVRLLLREVPLYHAWYRARLGWVFNDKTYPALIKDPSWPYPGRSLNEINEGYRRSFIRYITDELGDRTDLLPVVVPPYPPFGKRLLLDNGWYRTLTRPDVTLVTDRINKVLATGVEAAGTAYDLDVVVYATGFDVLHFLSTYEVVGREGRRLAEEWDDNARAYLGTTVPGYPNFFVLYGPNTQPGHGGSIVFTIECQVNYVLQILERMAESEAGAVECRPDVAEAYNERVDATHANLVWTHPGMETYYRNSAGRVAVNYPYRNVDFFQVTRLVNPDDYIWEARRD